MHPWPERCVQFVVCYGVGPVPGQDDQQVEGSRREMDVDSLPPHQACADVDDNCIHTAGPGGLYESGSRPRTWGRRPLGTD